MSFKPNPSEREMAIAQILRDVFGDDTEVPEATATHYDVDVSMLDMMLDANPSEEHLFDYFGIQSPGADVARIREVTRRLLLLLRNP